MAVTPAVIQPSDNSGDAIPLMASTTSGRNNLATYRNGLVSMLTIPGSTSMGVRGGVLGRQVSTVTGANGFNDFRVHAPSTANGLQFNVEPGAAVVPSSATGGGSYLVHSRNLLSLTLDPANTGNPRYDLVYLAVSDLSAGAASTSVYVGVVTGSASANPSIPSLPTGTGLQTIGMWVVYVPANTANFSGTTLTDVRQGTTISQLPRPRLGYDINAGSGDVGYAPGERRLRPGTSPLPLVLEDVWGYDGVWHGTRGFSVSTKLASTFTVSAANTDLQVLTYTIPDPGWQYTVKVAGAGATHTSTSPGTVILKIAVGTASNVVCENAGQQITGGIDAWINIAPFADNTVRSGSTIVYLLVNSNYTGTVAGTPTCWLTVDVIPV